MPNAVHMRTVAVGNTLMSVIAGELLVIAGELSVITGELLVITGELSVITRNTPSKTLVANPTTPGGTSWDL